tara:strand:- start:1977 stop:2186 length:210 start_codon:yes stop_codon:yes gene_type:complete
MEALWEALAFLVQAITIGGITGVVLAIVGIVPVEIHRNIELHVSNKDDATKILKSWGLALGTEPEEEEY